MTCSQSVVRRGTPCVRALTAKSAHWADCRQPLVGSRFPDHYVQVLLCQHDCVRELATRPGRLSPIENFLPLHYDYLQFAYYRGKAWVIRQDLWGRGWCPSLQSCSLISHCHSSDREEQQGKLGMGRCSDNVLKTILRLTFYMIC